MVPGYMSLPSRKRRKPKATHDLKILYTNIRGLFSNRNSLIAMVQDCNPDIIALTESFLSPQIGSAEVGIPGYVLFRSDRNHISDSRRGGSCVYVRSNFNTREVKKSLNKPTETILLEIDTGGHRKVILGCVYRSTSPKFRSNEDYYINSLVEIESEYSGRAAICVMGDYNMPAIDWPLLRHVPAIL